MEILKQKNKECEELIIAAVFFRLSLPSAFKLLQMYFYKNIVNQIVKGQKQK